MGTASAYVPTAQTQLSKWFQNDSTYGSPPLTTAYLNDNIYAFVKLFNNGQDTAKYITILDDFPNDLIYDSAHMETSYDGGVTWSTDPNAYWTDFGTYSELFWLPSDIPQNGVFLFRIPAQVNVINKIITNNASETQRTFNPDGDNSNTYPNQAGFNTINATTTLNIPLRLPTALVVNPASGFKGDIVQLVATLTNTHNNIPLNGKTINFFINGIHVGSILTNLSGVASFAYTITQNTGTYTILAEFLQDSTYTASSNTNTLKVGDKTPPVVTSSNPVNNAVNVALNKVIQINFNKAIKLGTNPWIEFYNSAGTGIKFTTSIVNNVLSITPNSLLALGTTYYVVLHSNSVTNLDGVGLASPYTVKFTTTKPPVVTSTNPVNNSQGASLTSPITVKFSSNIVASNNYSLIYVKNITTGQTVSITKSISGNTLTIKTNSSRLNQNVYQVFIPAGAVKDTAGTKFAADYSFRFKTG